MGDTKKEEEKIENEFLKYKIGTVGNFVFLAFIVMIIGTGVLIYYLLHIEKDKYDLKYGNLTSNTVSDNDTKEDESIANMIGTVISNVIDTQTINNSVDNSSKKIMNEELVVLYNGLLLNISEMNEVKLNYIDTTKEDKDKYVITYYSYENFSFKESKLGILSSPVYDGLVKVENVGKVAISEDYNAIPRNIKVINTLPTIIVDKNPKIADYESVKVLMADLDGNSTEEYILVLVNKEKGISKIVLVTSEGNKVADLASIERNSKDDTSTEYYFSIDNIEVIDVDNDGIMEILLEIPQLEGNPTISLLKYRNGELLGKTNIKGLIKNK